MRALVTGATGFLGSHLARRLADRGDVVRVLVRPTSDRRRLDGLPLELVEGDVTDAASVERALADVDLVFHTAALVQFGPSDPSQLQQVNVQGTRNVVGGAAARDILAVHVSSVAALGPTGPDPVDESWWYPGTPVGAYETTKRDAHLYVRELASAGKPVRIGSPGGIYGYGDESTLAKLIRAFVLYPLLVGYMPDLVQSVVNVDDCADALLRIADAGADGEEYLISAQAVTFRQWFEAIAAGAGRRPPLAYVPTGLVRGSRRPASSVARWVHANPQKLSEMIETATCHRSFSGDKLRRELGWNPRSLRDGMTEMADGIKAAARRHRRA